MLPTVFGFPTYTLCLTIGLLTGLFLFFHRTEPVLRRRTALLVCFIIPGALFGAKALYLLALPAGTQPAASFFTGFVFYGGLIGGAVTGLIGARLMHLPALRLTDAAAPALALGHAIGRVGCYCAGCCFGQNGLPVQLMESAALLALGLYLLRSVQPKREEGCLAALYGMLYAPLRFLLEFLRADAVRGFAHGLSTGQWLSIALFLCSFLLLTRTSSIRFSLHNTSLLIDNRLLGGLLPIRFTARLYRDASGCAALRCTLFGRELALSRSRRTQFHFLDALSDFDLHIRLLHLDLTCGIPDDAASTAVLTGFLSAALQSLCAGLIAREPLPPDVHLSVKPSYSAPAFHVHAEAVVAFRTLSALRALLRTLRRNKRMLHSPA